MYYTQLEQRGLFTVEGEDVTAFLQGLITNDAGRLQNGTPIYAALLSPQGKYLHDFFLIPWQGKIVVDCEKGRMDDLIKRLTMYKLRSKVTIARAPESWGVAAVWDGTLAPQATAEFRLFEDPRLPQLGWRIAGDASAALAWCGRQGWQHVDALAYDRMRLEVGVPDGSRDMQPERAIVLYFGFEDLHGVDYNKGCYVGQEVIARAHYRGTIKKFLYQVSADEALPPPGTPVMRGEAQAGELLSSEGNGGLALLRIEEAGKASAGDPLSAYEVKLVATLPEWVKQKLPAAAEQ